MAVTNPLKTLSQALTGTPDLPTAEARAVQARQALIAAAQQVDQAKVQLMVADDAQDQPAIQKAEAAVISANRDADRASRGLAIAEGRLAKAQQAANESATADARKRLAALVADRERAGAQIENALTALAAGVKQLADTDASIATIPTDVLGPDYIQGHNGGAAALERHLSVELEQRGIQGRPSSVAYQTFAAWLAQGSDLLKARLS